MSEQVPAWKRLGLRIKNTVSYDPLAQGLEERSSSDVKKRTAVLNEESTRAPVGENEELSKKPPKRAKLAKKDKPPPPEPDQLSYLRQYVDDRAAWKFSKQKQNWIIKHIYSIEEKYLSHLDAYLSGIQGGSRDRIASEAKGIVTQWNEFMSKDEDENENESSTGKDAAEEASEGNEVKSRGDNGEFKIASNEETKKDAESTPPTQDTATRAQHIYKLLVDEVIPLAFVDSTESTESTESTTTAEPTEPTEPAEDASEKKEEIDKKDKHKDKKDKKHKDKKKDKKDKIVKE